MIGLKILPHFLNQSEVKPKPIVTCLHKFSRASCNCLEFWSYNWLLYSIVIGQSIYYDTQLKIALKSKTLINNILSLMLYPTIHVQWRIDLGQALALKAKFEGLNFLAIT